MSDASECMHSATAVPVLLSRANIAESKARAIKGRGLAAQSRADAMKQGCEHAPHGGQYRGYVYDTTLSRTYVHMHVHEDPQPKHD